MRTFWTVIITLVVAGVVGVAGLLAYSKFGDEPSGYVDETFVSEILNGKTDVHVRLPWHYDEEMDRRYPLIIKLDGTSRLDWHDRTLAVMDEMGLGDAIVVAIPNGGQRNRFQTPQGWPQNTDEADPLGEGGLFLDYLESEIIPDIEARYRTNERRVFVGYSRGGLLVMHALITRPELFDGHVMLSPAFWREDSRIVGEAEQYFNSHPDHASTLFMSLGTEENEKMTAAYDAMIATLERTAPDGLNWAFDRALGGTHQTTNYLALPRAYEAMFAAGLAEATVP